MKIASARLERIRSWMESTLEAGKVERFNDLHIDEIDPIWKKKERWIEAGLEAFEIATTLRSHDRLRFDVALVFSLKAGNDPRGLAIRDSRALESELDWSPPSLYLLKPGEDPWAQGAKRGDLPPKYLKTKPIDPRLLGASKPTKACYFMEFKPADSSEFSRSVLLIG